MTIKELYEWALKEGFENSKLYLLCTNYDFEYDKCLLTDDDIFYFPCDNENSIYISVDNII